MWISTTYSEVIMKKRSTLDIIYFGGNQQGTAGSLPLTGKQIDKLARYYTNAIRDNKDDPDAMKKAAWATFYHRFQLTESPNTNPKLV